MSTIPIRIGSIIVWRGAEHRITRLVNIEYVLAVNLDSGELEKVLVSEIRPVVDSKDECKPEIIVSELNDQEWELAQKRLKIIEPLLDFGTRRTQSNVEFTALKSGVSQATLYRWLSRYESSGKLSSLVNKRRHDKGSSRLNKEQDKILDICIQREFLKLERPTIKRAYDDYVYECKKAALVPCSHSSFSRRVKKIAPQAVALKRYGKKEFIAKHSEATGKFPGGNFPLDTIQIDHTKPNVILVDDRDRLPIGRPWVTFCIDIFSRVITGYYLALEAPSATSVGLCLTHSILRKDTWLAERHIDTLWPCWGLMRTVHADNGPDFRSKSVDRACEQYNIALNWRPLGRPDYGGHVERLMRTVKTDLSNLKGTTFRNPEDRGEYDSEGRAIFTFEEFQRWLVTYITKYYHQRVHSDLDMSPLAKWEEGLFFGDKMPMHGLPDIIEDERRLYLDFLPFKKRTVQRYGISISNVTYFHPSIARWIGVAAPYPDEKFVVKYELHQINHIYFLDPDTKEYLEIPRVYRDAPNMTRFELKKVRQHLKLKGQENIDEHAIIEAQRELKEIEEKASTETTAMRRMRQRKIQAPKAVTHIAKASPNLQSPEEQDWEEVDAFDDIDMEIE